MHVEDIEIHELTERLSEHEERLRVAQRLVRALGRKIRPGDDRVDAAVSSMSGSIEDLAVDARDLHRVLDLLMGKAEAARLGVEPTKSDPGLTRRLVQRVRFGLGWRVRNFRHRLQLGLLRTPRKGESSVDAVMAPAPVRELPIVSIVWCGESSKRTEAESLQRAVRAQSDSGFELVLWDRDSGAYTIEDRGGAVLAAGDAAGRDDLIAVISGDYVLTLRELGDLVPTLVETLRWAMASEELLLFVCEGQGRDAIDERWSVITRMCWSTEGWQDERSQAALIRRCKRSVLGRIIEIPHGDHPLPHVRSSESKLSPGLTRLGQYLVVEPRRGPTSHRYPVRALAMEAEAPEKGDQAPGILILVGAPLSAGLEAATGDLLRQLSSTHRGVVVNVANQGVLGTRRLRSLLRRTSLVYNFEGMLSRLVWESALDTLVEQKGISGALCIGDEVTLLGLASSLRAAHPDVRLLHMPVGLDGGQQAEPDSVWDGQVVLYPDERGVSADGSGQARRAVLPLAIDPRRPPRVPARDEIRAQLGLRESSILVTMMTDLLPVARPEDFVGLARRFRDDPRYAFLLVGEGPLATSVRDIARLLELPRLGITKPALDLAAYAVATDIACSTSEEELLPIWIAAAMAAGKPVVAAAEPRIPPALAEASESWGLSFVEAGNLSAFEDRIRSLAGADGFSPREATSCLERSYVEAVEIIRRALTGP